MREPRVEGRGPGQATRSTAEGPGLGPGKRTLTEGLPVAGEANAAQSYSPPGPLPPTGAELEAAEHARLQAVEPTKTTAPDPVKGGDKADDKVPPDMTGIGATVAVDRFIVAAKDVQKNWSTLKTEERADHLGKAANAELKAAGCYEVTPNLEDLSEAGKFHFSTWVLGLGKAPFGAASVDDGQAAEIADTVYHESRHAEQWHRMARLLAGKGTSAADIMKKLGIAAKAAADAATKPLKDATTAEGKEASAWYESVYGSGAAHRTKLLGETLPKYSKLLDDAAAEYSKVTADKAATKDQKDAAYKKWVEAYDVYKKEAGDPYHALPEEADAWAVAGKMKAAYTKK
jgi:hypothetical protein